MKKKIKDIEFVIITGMSGAGKTQALNFFEDKGYFCIDNLPTTLLKDFTDIYDKSNGKIKKLAFVIDIRSWDFIEEFYKQIKILRELDINYKVIFMDARDEIILNRFNLTRRKHPLKIHKSLLKNIEEERKRLEEIRNTAGQIIDTSNLNPKALFMKLGKELGADSKFKFNITFMSFGFKYGIPLDLDMMFDVRFLPNPYYIDSMKNKTGNQHEVQEYVMQSDESKDFFLKLKDLLDFLIPYFIREGKSHFTVGIGCTGGKHRSVTFVNRIYEYYNLKNEYMASASHRDVNK